MFNYNELLQLREQKLTYQEIGNKLGVSKQRIHQIMTGYRSDRHFSHITNSMRASGINNISSIPSTKFYKKECPFCHTTTIGKNSKCDNRDCKLKRMYSKKTITICKPSNEDLAWIAGLLDGEGCFLLYNSRRQKFYPKITLCMTHKLTIQCMLDKLKSNQLITHIVSNNDKHKDSFTVSINGINAIYLCQWIKPYSITKKDNVEIMANFLSHQNLITISQQIKINNKRGIF